MMNWIEHSVGVIHHKRGQHLMRQGSSEDLQRAKTTKKLTRLLESGRIDQANNNKNNNNNNINNIILHEGRDEIVIHFVSCIFFCWVINQEHRKYARAQFSDFKQIRTYFQSINFQRHPVDWTCFFCQLSLPRRERK